MKLKGYKIIIKLRYLMIKKNNFKTSEILGGEDNDIYCSIKKS